MGNLYWYQMIDSQDERERWLEQSVIDTDDLIWLFSNPDDPDFMPIEISEEWLLKSGFVKDEEYDNTFNLQISVFNGFTTITIDIRACVLLLDAMEIKIKHIHQLQNLFHALTGEELQIRNHKS